MTRKLRPLAALSMVALIGVIGAGCGSNTPSETGAASSTGAAISSGNTSTTATASKKRVADQDTIGSPSSAGSPPSPARRLPTQSTHERSRHE
jgi:hypothetical protein